MKFLKLFKVSSVKYSAKAWKSIILLCFIFYWILFAFKLCVTRVIWNALCNLSNLCINFPSLLFFLTVMDYINTPLVQWKKEKNEAFFAVNLRNVFLSLKGHIDSWLFHCGLINFSKFKYCFSQSVNRILSQKCPKCLIFLQLIVYIDWEIVLD